ncbi:MAG TPA: hypothetical protein VHR45_13820 [Thermoanaerobaculia bacterium]|nr:hypothetical protein [Thermoanaerobaculia bacterium]
MGLARVSHGGLLDQDELVRLRDRQLPEDDLVVERTDEERGTAADRQQ